ncbi:MAG: acetyl-CoA carboxylase biotin carboxyl carrier protein [Clostridiales bacterium]|jgi:acetyl-CoA carboxylase biotin carboxyl carrier protein|nr:acetyl-CoA carboxylase biotin carboxyl carrier protein [Clostridiales bacterium]
MDYKEIINIMRELNQTDLTKLEIEQNGIRILMEKGNGQISNLMTSSQTTTISPLQEDTLITNVAQSTVSHEALSSAKSAVSTEPALQILSPMVGTFYAQPAPDKPPYVKVGDKVKKGQTLCIIEAMKLMNEIESEYDGEIIEVLVNNEDMVEYGQPLFAIREC